MKNSMIVLLVILILILLATVVLIVLNKENEKMVQIGIKVLVISIVSAFILVAFELSSPLKEESLSVNVLIPRDKTALYPHDFSAELMRVGSKHKNGFQLFQQVLLFSPKKKDKEIDSDLIGFDLLEMTLWVWLSKKYHLHWQTEEVHYEGISGWGYTIDKAKNAEDKTKKVTYSKLEEYLIDNFMVIPKGHFWGVMLPEKTEFSIDQPFKHEKIIKFKNTEMTFSISIKWLGNSGFMGTYLGDSIIKQKPEVKDWFSNNFRVTFKCDYNKFLRGSSKTKELKKWASQIMTDFQNDFEWSLIKKDLERAYVKKDI